MRQGKGLREVWYKTSDDFGKTWSAAVNITMQVHRPKQPLIDSRYNFSEDWRSYANTPGHAIQIKNGKYRGRIFVAANHSSGNPKGGFEDYEAHGFFTDDHGKTFHLGGTVNIPGGNESMAVELTNDKLMMNSRNQKGKPKNRIVSISSDAGKTWDTSYYDPFLIDPVCQGSILRLGEKHHATIIAFCNDADTALRNNLTLSISYDEGKTWGKKIIVDKSAGPQNDYTAYSDLVKISRNKVGILYERNGYAEIVFKVVRWK